MPVPPRRLTLLTALAFASVVLAACGLSSASPADTPTPEPASVVFAEQTTPTSVPTAVSARSDATPGIGTPSSGTPASGTAASGTPSSATATRAAGGTSTAGAGATSTPVAQVSSAAPATATPTQAAQAAAPLPTSGISFKPAQIVQGGTAIVYLNESATSATARFQERQYPMLHDGTRWWAIIGIGALTQPGLLPVSVTYTPSGRTTSVAITQSIPLVKRDFPTERIDLDPATSALLAPDVVQNEIQQRASIYSGFTALRVWNGPFQAPVRRPIGDIYGVGRSYNGAPVVDYHRGVDFVADTGEPVYAAASGRVVFTGPLKVRGNSVILDHGAGVFSAYHHLSQIDATMNQLVSIGERLGAVGSTGLVTGPHLHWEVIVRGVEVDGELLLKGADLTP